MPACWFLVSDHIFTILMISDYLSLCGEEKSGIC